MSTVKIKTEPTTATAATVDVQVKLEPSLSTGDFKLEQHSSDIDTKVEFDSDADSNSKSETDDDDEDTDQDQFTIIPKIQRHFICEYVGCGRSFNRASYRGMHQHEHRLQAELNIHAKTCALTRQSLNDRWPCPIPDCTSTAKTVHSLCSHIRVIHGNAMKQQQNQPQQSPSHITQRNLYFADVDNFYVNNIRCGYHNAIRVFICHECRLVPECLLTHLQQKHGYDEKSIDNSVLPESAVNANADPSVNQHTNNPHLASAIRQPYQHHQYIVQAWLCVTSDCGYCGYTFSNKNDHKRKFHQNEQFTTVPALVLRLSSSKTQSSFFHITRIGQASGAVTTSKNRVSQHTLDYSQNGLNAQDENGDDIGQSVTTGASKQKRLWKCEYSDCRRSFNTSNTLCSHRREHSHEVVVNVYGTSYTLTRQSLDDRWPCPVPDCETTWKSVFTTREHIQQTHSTLIKQIIINSEDDDSQRQQNIKRKQRILQYLMVDDFYVCGARCGFHTTTGVFICYKCTLVPECLLTHLQQKHGYDEKSINNSVLPESAVNAGTDPNGNQHTSNTHLASAINRSYQQQHQNIVQGWLCVAADCGYCCSTQRSRNRHQRMDHKGEQVSTVPALVLRLLYGKTQTSCFLIARLDTISDDNIEPTNTANQHNNECEVEDDGDELVLSDYSDEDDIH